MPSPIAMSSMPAISAKSSRCVRVRAVLRLVWWGPPASSQASAATLRPGLGSQRARATGRRGRSSGGLHDVDLVEDEPEALAEVEEADDDAGAGPRGEDQPHRVRPATDRQGMDLACRPAVGDRRADLEHVGAQDLRSVRTQVVGVVLHEGRPARQAGRHDLHRPDEQRRLPIAFGTESVAVSHQPLNGDPRELDEVAQVLERVGEGTEAAGLQEVAESDLDPGGLTEGGSLCPRRAAVTAPCHTSRRTPRRAGRRPVGRRPDGRDEVPDAVSVDADAQLDLGLDLVAFRDRHLAHVVAEAGEPESPELVEPAGSPGPGGDPIDDVGVPPVADDRRPG